MDGMLVAADCSQSRNDNFSFMRTYAASGKLIEINQSNYGPRKTHSNEFSHMAAKHTDIMFGRGKKPIPSMCDERIFLINEISHIPRIFVIDTLFMPLID